MFSTNPEEVLEWDENIIEDIRHRSDVIQRVTAPKQPLPESDD